MSDVTNPLDQLSKEELRLLVEHLQEEVRMTRAFSNISETGANDAALQWQGRNRFLSERVIPVQLVPSVTDSFQAEQGNHRIYNGDNLSVMTSLLTDFRGGRDRGVDVIYLDPPYNTGGDMFSYNDDYRFTQAEVKRMRRKARQTEKLVSLDDPSRHTKWINHIAPRLWAARKLLKSTGVIIVSIDEHELPRLWMLMEEMFGEKNRLVTLVWERSRKNDANYISEGHEYMLVWARNKEALDAVIQRKGKWREVKPGLQVFVDEFNRLREINGHNYDAISEGLKTFVRGIDKSSSLWTIRQYVGVDANCVEFGPYKEEDASWPKPGGPKYDVFHPETNVQVRTPPNGWRRSDPDHIYDLHNKGRVSWKGTGTPKIKKYLLEGRESDVVTSVIQKDARYSVMLLKSLLGFDSFSNPKDPQLLERLFNIVTWRNPNAVILDAYAGSGTTGQAVLDMNAEDGGNRRFILIENGDPTAKGKIDRACYTTNITAARVRRVICGEWADGKPHPTHNTGFTFYNADRGIDKAAIMSATRETLADIILQVVEDDSNRIDCRMDGDYQYLIGRTRLGYGIALVWEGDNPKNTQALTMDIVDVVLDEAREAGVTRPVFIYATSNIAPRAEDLYRFQHIPDSILARLSLLPGEGEDEE